MGYCMDRASGVDRGVGMVVSAEGVVRDYQKANMPSCSKYSIGIVMNALRNEVACSLSSTSVRRAFQ